MPVSPDCQAPKKTPTNTLALLHLLVAVFPTCLLLKSMSLHDRTIFRLDWTQGETLHERVNIPTGLVSLALPVGIEPTFRD